MADIAGPGPPAPTAPPAPNPTGSSPNGVHRFVLGRPHVALPRAPRAPCPLPAGLWRNQRSRRSGGPVRRRFRCSGRGPGRNCGRSRRRPPADTDADTRLAALHETLDAVAAASRERGALAFARALPDLHDLILREYVHSSEEPGAWIGPHQGGGQEALKFAPRFSPNAAKPSRTSSV